MQRSSWLYHAAEANMNVKQVCLSLYYRKNFLKKLPQPANIQWTSSVRQGQMKESSANAASADGKCHHVPDTVSTGFVRNLVQQKAKYTCTHLLCIGSVCMLASIHEQTQQMVYLSQCYSAHLH